MKGAVTHYCRGLHARYIAATLLCALTISGCGGPVAGSEEQVRRWLSAAQGATETRDQSEFMELISDSYADSRGFDRDAIGDMMRVYFLRQQSIKLLPSIDEIRLHSDSAADIELTVAMTGKNDSVFGFSADAYRFKLELERDDDKWLLISARWAELGKELH